MSYYSLVASLPHLQIGDEPPFSTEEYIDNCAQWVTDHEIKILRRVLHQELDDSHCPLCMAWNNVETQIRNTAARSAFDSPIQHPADALDAGHHRIGGLAGEAQAHEPGFTDVARRAGRQVDIGHLE